jgi:hypothetical protein
MEKPDQNQEDIPEDWAAAHLFAGALKQYSTNK